MELKVDFEAQVHWTKAGGDIHITDITIGGQSILKCVDQKEQDSLKELIQHDPMLNVLDNASENLPLENIPVEIDYSYKPGTKAAFNVQHGNFLPGDEDELNITSAKCGGVDIWPYLSDYQKERIKTCMG